MQPMRIEALTPLRFVAAMIVVISHFGAETGLASVAGGFLTTGPQTVSFFFVLSGFVLTLAYCGRWERSTPSSFWWARVARIVPVYLLALVFTLSLPGNAPSADAKIVVLDLLFLQAWFPPYPLAINGPAWSLSVEAFFYFSFPLSLWCLKQSAPRAGRLLIASLMVWAFAQAVLDNLLHPRFYAGFPSTSFDLIHYFPLTHLPSFWLGIAGGYWLLQHRSRIDWSTPVSTILVATTTAVLIASLAFKDLYASLNGFRAPLHGGFFAPLFLSFILVLSVANARSTAWLAAPMLVLFGEASYSLYLLQQPIHQLYSEFIVPRWGFAQAVGFYGYAVLLVLVSIGVFLTFERPLQRGLRRLMPRHE
jgi:peptidoglycan/LPS O-acetylase OafA/YrhL